MVESGSGTLCKREPLYDWDDILRVHAAATKYLEQHAWLNEWNRLSDDHSLEVHIFSMEIGVTEKELDQFGFTSIVSGRI